MNARTSMKHLIVAAAVAAALMPVIASAQTQQQRPAGSGIQNEKSFPAIASGQWTGPRLPDGQPDIAGFWSNTIANHNNFTDPQGGVPGDPDRSTQPKGPRGERAPSRVSDPADGQVPFQPWARAKQQEFLANFHNPTQPQFIEPLARCAPGGIPKSFYWHGYEIRQFPGYIVFIFGAGSRIIHLDGKPHLPEKIKLWNASSRGRWEGNTLIVDVRNNNAKALFGRTGEFASENVRVEERFIFDDKSRERYNYVATFTDPSVYTRTWSATIPARKYTEASAIHNWHYEVDIANTPDGKLLHESHEQICIENNGPFGQVAVGP